MKYHVFQLIALLSLGGISPTSLASDGPPATLDDLDLRGSDCILIRTIRDYTPLDDRNLLIWGPAKRGYYVSLFRPVFGMRSSFRLGFSSRDDMLCPYGGDSVVVGGLNAEKVRVSSISRVSEEQAAEILIRFGKKQPPRQKDPAPADVNGADVEELG